MAANYSTSAANETTNDCSPLFTSDMKCDVLLGARRATGIISILCCIFILSVVILFKKYTFFSQRLILYLSVSAIFQAIGYIMGDYHIASEARNGHQELRGFCIFQGYWVLFFDWFSLLWVFCITFNIFILAVFSRKGEKLEKVYFVVVFGIALVISFLPFIRGTYGPAGLWCWIRSIEDGEAYSPGIAMQFSTFYVPFWIISIIMLGMLATAYGFVHRNSRQFKGHNQSNEIQMKLWQEEIRPLIFFPLLYIVILIFPSMNRLRYAFGYSAPDSPESFFFWFMHSVTLTLHGTVYALIFGCDRRTLSRLKWIEIKGAVMHWKLRSEVRDYPLDKISPTEDEEEDEDKKFYESYKTMEDEI